MGWRWKDFGHSEGRTFFRICGGLVLAQLSVRSLHLLYRYQGLAEKHGSMDWFKGKFTGKPHILWENLWFPVDFPLNQSIEYMNLETWPNSRISWRVHLPLRSKAGVYYIYMLCRSPRSVRLGGGAFFEGIKESRWQNSWWKYSYNVSPVISWFISPRNYSYSYHKP